MFGRSSVNQQHILQLPFEKYRFCGVGQCMPLKSAIHSIISHKDFFFAICDILIFSGEKNGFLLAVSRNHQN